MLVFVKLFNNLKSKIHTCSLRQLCQSLSFRPTEKSSQITPQREANLCRASNEDFSFLEMTRLSIGIFFLDKNQKYFLKINMRMSNIARGFNHGDTMHISRFSLTYSFQPREHMRNYHTFPTVETVGYV